MKNIYIIRAFDKSTWHEYFPIAFFSVAEADRYCETQEKIDKNICYTWNSIPIGNYEL